MRRLLDCSLMKWQLEMMVYSGKWPCGVCGKVQINTVQYIVCIKKWIHKWCSGDSSGVADGFMCRRCDGTIQDNLADGADLSATGRIRNEWMKFRELLPFLTSSPRWR